MVRHVTIAALVALEIDRRARGDHDVYFDDPGEDARQVLIRNTRYMGWGEDEGLPTLCHGAFLGIVLAGAIFDHSVDDVVFETRVVSMECTRRLWECILAGGFKPPDNDRSDFGALLRAIQEVVPSACITCAGDERISPCEGFDTSELRNVIGDIGETPLSEGIRETVALYRSIAERNAAGSG